MTEKSAIAKYLNFIHCFKDSLAAPDLSLEAMTDVISRHLSQSQLNHFIDYLTKNYEGKYGEKTHNPYAKTPL